MWSSLPPAPPGDEGLQLTDQSYHAHPSPQSPTTPSYTFQRVQAIKQNISNSSETDKDGMLCGTWCAMSHGRQTGGGGSQPPLNFREGSSTPLILREKVFQLLT